MNPLNPVPEGNFNPMRGLDGKLLVPPNRIRPIIKKPIMRPQPMPFPIGVIKPM